ncbi:interferon-inducible GTPase 5-like [Gopherus evgoodei]|uniref:interferon-inducible GTPase 5-like n=1 Tax=Gopherus evgoodei TaxID=1825980 RepID=UPI0011CEE10F|nr:interferon-inducible GTPase 5-like [Gopherus evgoodei]XP_030399376.1 interferon-inducible GTPase 5-like [Gopherus evgoodei]
MSEEKFKAAVQEGNLKKAVSMAQQIMKSLGCFHIAVIGKSGSGKSSFVNAFRGLRDDDKGAAEVGVVETTKEPTSYSYPDYPNVFLWDLPGIETPNFQSSELNLTVTYYQYDFFIIITATRFRDIHANLAQKIQEKRKKFFFVRSKVDQDLEAEMRKKFYCERTTLQQIREACQGHLQNARVNDTQVFLLSNWEPDKHDFPLLKKTLEEVIPHHATRQRLLMISNQTLQAKKTAMQKTTWKPATLSGGLAAIPLPGLSLVADIAIMVDCMRDYCKDFGLNSESLSALAHHIGKREKDLKAVIKSPLATEITTDLVLTLLSNAAGGGVKYLSFLGKSFIPVIGSLFSAQVSFGATMFMLDNFIRDLAEDTQRVLVKALGEEEKKSK